MIETVSSRVLVMKTVWVAASTATPDGLLPAGIANPLGLVRVLTTETVSLSELVTYAVCVAESTATASGWTPTQMVSAIRSVVVSITVTVW